MRGSRVTRCDQEGQYRGQAFIAGESSVSFYIILSIAIICGWLQYYLEVTSITLQVSKLICIESDITILFYVDFSDILSLFQICRTE